MVIACVSLGVMCVVDELVVVVVGEVLLSNVVVVVFDVFLSVGVFGSESEFLSSCSFPSFCKKRDIVAAIALLSVLTCSFLILCSVVSALAGRPLVAPILPSESLDPLLGSNIIFAFFPPACSVLSVSVCVSLRFSFVFMCCVVGAVSVCSCSPFLPFFVTCFEGVAGGESFSARDTETERTTVSLGGALSSLGLVGDGADRLAVSGASGEVGVSGER